MYGQLQLWILAIECLFYEACILKGLQLTIKKGLFKLL